MNTTTPEPTAAQLQALYAIEERSDIKSLQVTGPEAAIINGIPIEFDVLVESFLGDDIWKRSEFAWHVLLLNLYRTVELYDGTYSGDGSPEQFGQRAL